MTVRSDNRIGVDGFIPAVAGMTVRSDNRIGVDGIIPALAGMTAETPVMSFEFSSPIRITTTPSA